MGALVREAFERMVTPEATSAVIELALLRTGDLALPEQPCELAAFVRDPLSSAASCELGRDVAEALLEDLQPLLDKACEAEPPAGRKASGVRRKDTLPVVLVATEDRSRAQALRQALVPDCRVVWAGDVFDLLARLDGFVAAELVVVLDCRTCSVRPASVDSLASRVPPRARVILWDCGRRLRRQLLADGFPAHWLVMHDDAPVDEVVDRCRAR